MAELKPVLTSHAKATAAMKKESEPARVVIYTRSGCHLCEEIKVEILAAGCADEYVLDEIDIETEPELLERYRTEIPVVFINGVKAFKYRLTSREFRRKLRRLLKA